MENLPMTNLIDRYTAVWNEPNADARRAAVAALWAPDGATLHRLIEARGYSALEARVAGAYEKVQLGDGSAHGWRGCVGGSRILPP